MNKKEAEFVGHFNFISVEEVRDEIAKLLKASAGGNGYATLLLHFWSDPGLCCQSSALRKGIIDVDAKTSNKYRLLAFDQLGKMADARSLHALALFYQNGWPPVKISISKAANYWMRALKLGDYEFAGHELLALYTQNGRYQNLEKARKITKLINEMKANQSKSG